MPASILLVDDDPPFREALARALRAAGHAVEEATDGAHALRVLAAEAPDVLITDIMMPESDGIGLINAVKRDHPAVRILAVSGRGRMGKLDLLDLAGKLGAHGTLAKPFDAEDVLAKLEQIMAMPPGRGPEPA